MKINQDGIEITKRFFQAIDLLVQQGELRGLQSYTREYKINRWNLITLKKNPEICVLKPEYIVPLLRDFNISSEWIMLGKGRIFNY